MPLNLLNDFLMQIFFYRQWMKDKEHERKVANLHIEMLMFIWDACVFGPENKS